MDEGAFFATLFGALAMTVIMTIIFAIITPNVPQEICEYEGGTYHDDICVVDGQVFDIDYKD